VVSRYASEPEAGAALGQLLLAFFVVWHNPTEQLPEVRTVVWLAEMGQLMNKHVVN